MGAATFNCTATGESASQAFNRAVEDHQWEYGHGGYTGTIAEKHSFVMMGKAANAEEARKKAYEFIEARDKRIDNKWGPAGCLELPNKLYWFFGWASE